MSPGAQRRAALVTTETLDRRKLMAQRNKLPALKHVLLIGADIAEHYSYPGGRISTR